MRHSNERVETLPPPIDTQSGSQQSASPGEQPKKGNGKNSEPGRAGGGELSPPRDSERAQPEVQSSIEHRDLNFITGALDLNGRTIRRTRGQSSVRIEHLSASVPLLMVEIPAGRLSMGTSAMQARNLRSEHLRHGATAAETAEVLRREMP